MSGWDNSKGTIDCPTVTGVVAYDHPVLGQTFMFVFHQAIHLIMMENHLMCPMQCRVHGVRINDTPRMFVKKPTKHSHAIVVEDSTNPDKLLVIPLHIVGVASAFLVRTPSLVEFNDEDIPRAVRTSESSDWEP